MFFILNKFIKDEEDFKEILPVCTHFTLFKGVGKSTIAANLAISLGRKSHKVGIIDFDICGPSIANLLQVQDKNIVNSPWGWKPLM